MPSEVVPGPLVLAVFVPPPSPLEFATESLSVAPLVPACVVLLPVLLD
jgi:hypothetical protein